MTKLSLVLLVSSFWIIIALYSENDGAVVFPTAKVDHSVDCGDREPGKNLIPTSQDDTIKTTRFLLYAEKSRENEDCMETKMVLNPPLAISGDSKVFAVTQYEPVQHGSKETEDFGIYSGENISLENFGHLVLNEKEIAYTCVGDELYVNLDKCKIRPHFGIGTISIKQSSHAHRHGKGRERESETTFLKIINCKVCNRDCSVIVEKAEKKDERFWVFIIMLVSMSIPIVLMTATLRWIYKRE